MRALLVLLHRYIGLATAVFLLLAGLIFRGVAFEFRFKAKTSRYLWNWAFAGGRLLHT